ncbi:MAG: uracil-DNA glycosylase [Anaerolineaceae bacterium]|nr:MAG: uracil-DNA glycosylase [Anaerolineaceae bacterium]
MNPGEELDAVAAEVAVCTDCKLNHSRKNAVPGEGPANTDLVFIGEGPGFHENEQGRPFVGAAGRFLEELLASIGMTREEVFICNVIKCRPPGNRDPQVDEIQACSKYLDRQIAAINPKVLITLGRFSMARYFPNARISSIHGRATVIDGRLVVPMYHPAAALHQPSLRRVVEEDFALLPDLIARGQKVPAPEEKPPTDPEQLSMF